MMIRTDVEWLEICDKITAGYAPAGNKRTTFTSSGLQVERLKHWGCNLGPGVHLLDVGCGNGRLPMGLIYNGFDQIDYLGIDVILPCIKFCLDAFKPWPNFKFKYNNVDNKRYWTETGRNPFDFDLPIKSDFADIFWANSLFTHLGKPAVTFHYLEEAYRILKPGGTAICTWLIAENEKEISYDERKTIFLLPDVQDFYLKAGLKIISTENKFTNPQLEIYAVKE